jgi:hypothetical protein
MEDRNNVRIYYVPTFDSRILLMEMDCFTQEAKVVSDIRLCWRSGGNLFIWVESFIRVL